MRRLLLAVLIACIVPSAVPASAGARVARDASRARLEGVPAVVRSGQVLEVRWRDLPADVREVELELSVDGGRWSRISPELEALEGSFLWRVPEGVAGPAVVRLRAGGAAGEREVAESAFRLVGRVDGPGPALAWPGWWTREPRAGPAGAGFACPGPGLRAAAPDAPLAPPAQAGIERESAPVAAPGRRTAARPASLASSRRFRAPRRLPLRN